MNKPIIDVKNIGKKYSIGVNAPYYTLRESFSGLFRKTRNKSDFWALKNINFSLKEGEVLGVIGGNGAGKTTLLKLLSRITPPTIGEITLRGRVASLLEVGTGFHPELTGRENIFLNGAILGMRQREIKKKFAEIVAFAEIEKFLDTPVKHYSSGMYMRLAFAVAAHLEPEILLIDEVLSVGDAEFQKKCLGKMGEVAGEGRTILFVSHNIAAIRQLCGKCILLNKGELSEEGKTNDVVNLYLKRSFESDKGSGESSFKEDRTKDFQVLSVSILDGNKRKDSNLDCDKPFYIEMKCVSRKPVPGLYGYLSLVREGSEIIVSDTHDKLLNKLSSLDCGLYKVLVRVPERTVGHGIYSVRLAFASGQYSKGFYVDNPGDCCRFTLSDNSTERGNKRGGYLSTILPWEIQKL